LLNALGQVIRQNEVKDLTEHKVLGLKSGCYVYLLKDMEGNLYSGKIMVR